MSVVFSDGFTVGADTPLESYPSAGAPDYASILGGNNLDVNAARDRVEGSATGQDIIYRLIDAAVPTGDSEISADVGVLDSWEGAYIGQRGSGSQGDSYTLVHSNSTDWEIYRCDAGSFTLLASYSVAGTASNSTVAVKLKATGTNPVVVQATVAGSQQTAYNDSSASRKQSGTPVIGVYQSAVNSNAFIDNVSVDDLQAGGTTYNLSISEAASAADAMSAVAALLAAVNEAAAALDAMGGGLSIAGTISEAATAADAVDGQRAISLSVTEPAAAADQVGAQAALVGGLIEGGAAADQVSSTAVLMAGLAETANAQDATGLEGNAYALSLAETAAATDQVSAQLVAAAALAETAAASDQVSAQATLVGGVDEAATALDALTTQLDGVAGVAEAAAASDFYAASGGTAEAAPTLPPRPAMKRVGGSMAIHP